MAIWYVDTSATYDGDGTASTGAASDGAAGAAKDFEKILLNTHPYVTTMLSGDTINVRTHDGTSNCKTTLGDANKTCAIPSAATDPTTVIFDDGTIWGDVGVFELEVQTSRLLTLSKYMRWLAGGKNYRFNIRSLYSGTSRYVAVDVSGYFDGLHYTHVKADGSTGVAAMRCIKYRYAYFAAVKVEVSHCYDYNLAPFAVQDHGNVIIDWFEADLSSVQVANQTPYPVIWLGYGGSSLVINGGKITSPWAGGSIITAGSTGVVSASRILVRALDHGVADLFYPTSIPTEYRADSLVVIAQGCNGPYNYYRDMGHCIIDYTAGEFYPYLNARLPSAWDDGWSYRVYPINHNKVKQEVLVPLEKIYDQPAAVKTLAIHFLINTVFGTPKKDELCVTFSYVDDSTGDWVQLSTLERDGSDVDAGSSGWVNTTYGGKSYTALKCEVTTTSTIKRGTAIYASIHSSIGQQGVDDFYFYDPDIDID